MKNLSIERLANPEFLRIIIPELLKEFLNEYAVFFSLHDIDVGVIKFSNDDDYRRITRILMNPQSNPPHELFDKLFLVHGASDSIHQDKLLDIINKSEYKDKLDKLDDPSGVDMALLIAMNEKRELERLCIEQDISKRKSSVYFRAIKEKAKPHFNKIDKDFLDKMTEIFNFHFGQRKRGRKSAEIIYDDLGDGSHMFVIRKGAPMARQEAIEDAGSSITAIFRPAIYDMVIFRPSKRELRVSMPQKAMWTYKLYQEKFGEFLYDDETYFSESDLITLEPIKKNGRGVLKFDDVVDENNYQLLESVRMTACAYSLDDSNNEVVNYKADEVFNLWDTQGIELPEDADMISATFKIGFKYEGKSRPVTITKGNKTSYHLDHSSPAIEQWIEKRGFAGDFEDDEYDE